MRRIAALAAAVVLLVASAPTDAVFHLALTDEVMSGASSDATAQYVEVRMVTSGQQFVKNTRISAWDCAGAFIGELLLVPNDLCNGVTGARWSAGTPSWAALHPATPPDFPTMASGIPAACGTVCWGAPSGSSPAPNPATWAASNANCYTGCLAYGGATPPSTSTACLVNPPGAVFVETANIAAGDGMTNSLQRNSSPPPDFVLATKTPANNGCPSTTTTTTLPPAPLSKCTGSKFKAAGKKANEKTGCHAKAVAKAVTPDSTCFAKAEVKFSTAFAKAEAKIPNDCLTTGDATIVESDVDALIADLVTALGTGGPSKCSTSKYKAAGKKAKGKLDCHASALSKGVTVNSTCLAKTEVKFSTAFAKAEAKIPPDCLSTGDAAAVETRIDTFVDNVENQLVP